MGISRPQKCIWPSYDLDLWSLTFKFFSAVPTQMENCVNPFMEISRHGVDGQLSDERTIGLHNTSRRGGDITKSNEMVMMINDVGAQTQDAERLFIA